MSENNDNAMDEVARQIDQILAKQGGSSLFSAESKQQVDDMWLLTLMAEAHKAGEEILPVKLAYNAGDVDAVEWKDRVNRAAAAWTYASSWEQSRAA